MILKRININKYSEYIEYAKECTANRVYPLSIATRAQDGDIYAEGKGCILFWHYCGFAYISGDVNTDVLEEVYQTFLIQSTGCFTRTEGSTCVKRTLRMRAG